jgi:hypothetical protein
MARRSAGSVVEAAPGSPAAALASRPAGLRLRPQRPARAFFAALVVVAAVVAMLALYTEATDRSQVLALTQTVLAGDQIRDEDLQVVAISSDDELATVSAEQRRTIVGQYAKVRMLEGSLLAADGVQPEPLVTPGRVSSAVTVPLGLIPVGLREQSRVALVVTPGDELAGLIGEAPRLVEGNVSAVPANLAELIGSDAGPRASVSLSVEIAPGDVELVGSAAAVTVHVLGPNDPFPTSLSELEAADTPGNEPATAATTVPASPSASAPGEAAPPSTTGPG